MVSSQHTIQKFQPWKHIGLLFANPRNDATLKSHMALHKFSTMAIEEIIQTNPHWLRNSMLWSGKVRFWYGLECDLVGDEW